MNGKGRFVSSFSLADGQNKKQKLREEVLAQRKSFHQGHPGARDELSHVLTRGLQTIRSQNRVWLGYKAVRSEANPELAIGQLGGSWGYPRVENGELQFYLTDSKSPWELGAFGISEPNPKTSQKVDMNLAEGILVPGVVFDLRGNRLGYGKAFYDRVLAEFKGHKVGVAYSVQVRKEIPRENHDIPMDFIATEKEFLVVKG